MGTYVGFATVGAFVAWYMCEHFMGLDLSGDGHSTVTWYQLTHWNQCSSWSNFHVSPARTDSNHCRASSCMHAAPKDSKALTALSC